MMSWMHLAHAEAHQSCCVEQTLSSQRKSYPRDFFNRGRLRVQLKQPDGSLTNPTIPTRTIHAAVKVLF